MPCGIIIRLNPGKVFDRHTMAVKIIEKVTRGTPDFKNRQLFSRFDPSFQNDFCSIAEKESSCSKVGSLFEGRTVQFVAIGVILRAAVMPGYFSTIRARIEHNKAGIP